MIIPGSSFPVLAVLFDKIPCSSGIFCCGVAYDELYSQEMEFGFTRSQLGVIVLRRFFWMILEANTHEILLRSSP
jgi:hypothetical protein